jgi:hypothetical protein
MHALPLSVSTIPASDDFTVKVCVTGVNYIAEKFLTVVNDKSEASVYDASEINNAATVSSDLAMCMSRAE